MNDSMKQDALKWLDMQRDAVNTEIAYALQSEQKQYHENLKIINWLAEAARIYSGEMSAVEFLNARDEMTAGTHKDRARVLESIFQSGHNNELAVEIVKKWKEEQDA